MREQPAKSGRRVGFHVRMPAALRDDLKVLAVRHGRTMEEETEMALRAHLGAARRAQDVPPEVSEWP